MTPDQQLERLRVYLATQEHDRRAEYAELPGDIPDGNLAAVLELQQAIQQDDFAYQLDVLRSKALYLSVLVEYIDKRILDPAIQEIEPVTMTETYLYDAIDCTVFHYHGGGPKTVCMTMNPYSAQSIALALQYVQDHCQHWYDADRESPHFLQRVWDAEHPKMPSDGDAPKPQERPLRKRGNRPQRIDGHHEDE